MSKTGIIDVGGGLRGSYTAGVYDWCHDNDISFDYCIGVSAGSANLSSFLAGQRGRNLKFYTDYNMRPESMGVKNYIKTRNFVDLDYIYGELTNSYGEYPLNYDALMENPAEFRIVATDALTGKPAYFDGKELRRDAYASIKASSPRISRILSTGTDIMTGECQIRSLWKNAFRTAATELYLFSQDRRTFPVLRTRTNWSADCFPENIPRQQKR